MSAVIVYGKHHTTSTLFIKVLTRLFERYHALIGDWRIWFVCDDRRDVARASALLSPESVTILGLYETCDPFDTSRAWPEETVRRWERQYGDPHLRRYLHDERILQGRPEEVKWRYLFAHLEYFERLYERMQPALFISGLADGLAPWVSLKVFRARGVRCASFGGCRFGDGSFVLDNPYEFLGIRERYREMHKRGLTDAERRAAQELLAQYQRGPVHAADHAAVRSLYQRFLPNPVTMIRLIHEAWWTDAKYYDLPLRTTVARALSTRRTWWHNTLLRRHTVTQPHPEEPYFFYPLQYEPESSLITFGRGWADQLQLIRQIHDGLPVDRWLYVKEHPSMASGFRSLQFYRQLLALPKVRLLDQRVASYDIIRNAEAVVTINGTAGWEALMHKRPVVLFGHAFYGEFGEGVVEVRGLLDELPVVFQQLRHWTIPEEPLLAFIAAVIACRREGTIIEPRYYPSAASFVLSEENLDALARLMLEQMSVTVSMVTN